MAENLIDLAQQALADAFYAERNGDLAEALRQYRLARGPLSVVRESEKDGLRMSIGDLDKKIEELQQRVEVTNERNTLRYAGVRFKAVPCDLDDPEESCSCA